MNYKSNAANMDERNNCKIFGMNGQLTKLLINY